MEAAAPTSAANGGGNVSGFFPRGWLAIAPDAFSYGPQILEVLPNAGAKGGGDTIQIYGYGFGTDATQITAKIGGASSVVQKVEIVTTIAPSLALHATYPFPFQPITLLTPPGASGQSAVTVTPPSPPTTSPHPLP